jgi:hypothetical protein
MLGSDMSQLHLAISTTWLGHAHSPPHKKNHPTYSMYVYIWISIDPVTPTSFIFTTLSPGCIGEITSEPSNNRNLSMFCYLDPGNLTKTYPKFPFIKPAHAYMINFNIFGFMRTKTITWYKWGKYRIKISIEITNVEVHVLNIYTL